MKKLLLLTAFVLTHFSAISQVKLKTKNIILITLDGYRWQELFRGADSALIDNKEYTNNYARTIVRFGGETAQERRRKLMPFTWETIATKGQIYGNRDFDNKVDLTNPHWVSFPGYSEILCGYVDTLLSGNKKKNNPNITVLEFLNNKSEFKGKIAVFGSWDVFPFIINQERSKIPVNAGFNKVEGEHLSTSTKLLNTIQNQVPYFFGGARLDVFTHHLAMEYIEKHHPRVLFIGYGEPDEWGHQGNYEYYLQSVYNIDQFISNIWNYVQNNAFYKDKTTLIITTDHGRGEAKKEKWKDHGIDIVGAGEAWLAVIGPDSKALGEIKSKGQLYSTQIAQTISRLLGIEYTASKPVGKVIDSVVK